MLPRHGIRATAALNSDLCDHHPEMIEAAVAQGWEFMGQVRPTRRADEMARRPDGNDSSHTGTHQPRSGAQDGRMARCGLAETWHTLDHLADAGAEYVADWACDDLPFRMTLDRGTHACRFPDSLHCNDTVQFFDQKATAAEFGEIMRRQFDQLYSESRKIPRVMAVALHPFVSGMPYRVRRGGCRVRLYALASRGVVRHGL